jgi:hypothetical protein
MKITKISIWNINLKSHETYYMAGNKTFKNFVINIPSDINIYDYNTIVIWCERFEEFITAAKYQ